MDVEAVLKARDAASGTIGRVGRAADESRKSMQQAEKAAQGFERAGESLKQKLEGLAATIGIGFGIHELWEGLVGINAESETATRSLGGMLGGLYQFGRAKDPVVNLEKSIERSRKMMEDFDKTAMKTGISTKVLAETARTLAPGIASAHGKTEQLEQVTKQLAMTTKLIGGETGEGAQAMAMFLKYGMAMRSPLMVTLGLHGRIYQQMSAQSRLALLMNRLKGFGASPEALSRVQTWQDLMDKIRASVEVIEQKAGKPLFEAAKKEAARLAEWIEKNEVMLEKIGGQIADAMVTGMEATVHAAQFLSKHLETIKHLVEGIVMLWGSKQVFGGIQNAAGAFSKATSLSFDKMVEEKGRTFGILASAGMVAQAGIVGYTIGTALNGYLEKQDWWNKLWSPSKSSEQKVDDSAQARVQHGIEQRRASDRAAAGAINSVMERLHVSEQRAIKMLEATDLAKSGKMLYGVGNQAAYFGANQLKSIEMERGYIKSGKGKLPGAPDKLLGDIEKIKPQFNQNFFNARFDMHQEFAPGFDPDRVSVAFMSDLAKLGERKMASIFTPPFASR